MLSYKYSLLFFVWCALQLKVRAEKLPVEDDIIKTHTVSVQPVTEDNMQPLIHETQLQAFIHAFIAALSVIVVSEIGDKTFFIAAIMAMKHSRLIVFFGAASALTFMTVLSVLFGWLATVIPRTYTYYISTALFAFFGLKMLYEGYHMSPNEAQEGIEEVQSDLRKREDEANASAQSSQPVVANQSQAAEDDREMDVTTVETLDANGKEANITNENEVNHMEKMKVEKDSLTVDVEAGNRRRRQNMFKAVSRIFLQAFSLTFLAEWGDRSQLTTIILAAREDIYGVMLGGILGHSLCTGLAVLGGRFVAQRISVRTVTLIGGVVFLIFALSALFFNPMEDV